VAQSNHANSAGTIHVYPEKPSKPTELGPEIFAVSPVVAGVLFSFLRRIWVHKFFKNLCDNSKFSCQKSNIKQRRAQTILQL